MLEPLTALQPVVRWTPVQKRRLIEAIALRRIDLQAALLFHGIDRAEYDRWVSLYRLAGASALRVLRRVPGGPRIDAPALIAQHRAAAREKAAS